MRHHCAMRTSSQPCCHDLLSWSRRIVSETVHPTMNSLQAATPHVILNEVRCRAAIARLPRCDMAHLRGCDCEKTFKSVTIDRVTHNFSIADLQSDTSSIEIGRASCRERR